MDRITTDVLVCLHEKVESALETEPAQLSDYWSIGVIKSSNGII